MPAIGLYESCGYRIVSESTMTTTTTTTTSNDGSGGERSSTGSSGSSGKNDESGVPPATSPSSLGDKFMQFANKMGSVPKFGGGNGGGGGGEEEVHFMVKWIRRDVIDEKVKRMDETGVLKEIPTL